MGDKTCLTCDVLKFCKHACVCIISQKIIYLDLMLMLIFYASMYLLSNEFV